MRVSSDSCNHYEWGDTEDKNKYNDVIKKYDTELGGEKRTLLKVDIPI